MKFTRELPTVPGWYWVRNKGGSARIEHIRVGHGRNYHDGELSINVAISGFDQNEKRVPVSECDLEYMGPLHPAESNPAIPSGWKINKTHDRDYGFVVSGPNGGCTVYREGGRIADRTLYTLANALYLAPAFKEPPAPLAPTNVPFPYTRQPTSYVAGWNAFRNAVLALLPEVIDNAPAMLPEVVGDDLYYMQDSRKYVGNCPLWWRPPSPGGYTTRIDHAGKFTRQEARLQCRLRETDVAWPCALIDSLQQPTIDMQDLPNNRVQRAEFLADSNGEG